VGYFLLMILKRRTNALLTSQRHEPNTVGKPEERFVYNNFENDAGISINFEKTANMVTRLININKQFIPVVPQMLFFKNL
jgi:hypothetical protein